MTEIVNGRYDQPQLAEEEVMANQGAGLDEAVDCGGIPGGDWPRPLYTAYHTVDGS